MAAALQSFGPELWLADGPVVDVAGFRYPTRAAVVRLDDGSLWVWSPVALSDDLRGELAALGEVRHLIAPNTLHDRFLGEWQAAYPAARLCSAPGLGERRQDLRFDADLGDAPPPAWAGQIDQAVMRGNRITTEVVFFHARSRVVLFCDLIQHFAPGWFRGWRALVARLDGMTAPEPGVPHKFRLAFTDRRAARAGLARIREWPCEKLAMAHGAPVDADGRACIARAFRWLSP